MRPGIRSRPWAGLDVGNWSIKVIAAMGGRHWVAEKPISMSEPERDTPAGREQLAKLIAECLDRTGFGVRGLRGLSVGISGPDVILKQITLPYMDEAEVGPALRFEARKHLPFDPQGMVIDFQILGRSMTEKRMDVLLAAVTQERLERTLAPLRLIGLSPDIVDATPLALSNALFHDMPVTPETQIMLDLGHSGSHLVLYQKAEPYFARRFEFGGRSMAQAIARGMKIPAEEAEAWLGSLSGEVNWSLPEMNFVLDALRSDLLEELRRSVAFYRTVGRLHEPFTVWLSGGAARLPGLAAKLHELLDAPVKLFDPAEVLGGAAEAGGVRGQAPQLAQALGLAMRSA